MDSPLLMTKVHIPPTLPRLVQRSRLLTTLDMDLAQRRMTLLSAPAGYGKTTLVAAWIAYQRALKQGEALPEMHVEDGVDCCWYTLDEDDNDIVRFLTYLAVTLQHVIPEASEDSLVALQFHRPPSTTAVLATLLNAIDVRRDPVVLVLDDYHQIHGQAVHDAVTFLIEHLPDNLHLILMARADPSLSLARLRGQGRLHELRQADLQFSADETEAFLTLTCGMDIPPGSAAALTARTEGWIAGLQMAAVSLQHHTDITAFVATFTGSHRHILDFFVDEVISRQPPSVRTFLLQTSILEQMNGSLCDAVVSPRDMTEPLDGQAMLEYLEHANLFVIPQDDARSWYRYHRLFRELLLQELTVEAAELLPVLHRHASHWYATHDLPELAIDHALAAEEYALAAELIEAQAPRVMMRSELLKFQRWLAALPYTFLSAQPYLLVYRAAVQLLGGQPLELAEADLDAARKISHDQTIVGAMVALRGLIAAYQGRMAVSLQLLHQALESLPATAYFWRGLAAGVLGMNHAHSGDLRRANNAILHALDVAERTDNVMNVAFARCRIGELAVLDCRLDDARLHFAEARTRATRNGRALPIAGMAYMGLGLVHLERGELEDAVGPLEQGIGLIHAWGDSGAILGKMWLSAVQTLRGDWRAAEDALRSARQLAIQFDAMTMDDRMVEWQQVELWLAKDDRQAAVAWLERQLAQSQWSLLPEERRVRAEVNMLSTIKTITMARVCLHDHRPGAALALLAAQAEEADRPMPPRMVIDARLIEALALHALRRPVEARQRLTTALELAVGSNIVRPFLALAALVESILSTYDSPDERLRIFVTTLRSRLSLATSASSLMPAASLPTSDVRASTALVAPLTAREREILVLVAAGATNREIATQLVISLSTVKTHINNIYRKLDVHTRTSALVHARQLGLI